jgi:hypothetical protein
VPGRTYPTYNVPWVPPGRYTVRLTVDGAARTQPIVVSLDPRVRIAPVALAQLNTLSTALYWEAVAAHKAFNEAKALAATIAGRSGPSVESLKGDLEALAPTGLERNVRLLRRRGAGPAKPTLEAASNALQAAAMAMQAAEVAPTETQIAAATAARAQARPVMAQWAAVKAKAASLRP